MTGRRPTAATSIRMAGWRGKAGARPANGIRARVAVELQVTRGGGRYYMLVDVGGYYDAQIDKWFSAIAQRLGGGPAPVLVSKTTGSVAVRRGCLAGCLAYLVLGVCLAGAATPLDHALFP